MNASMYMLNVATTFFKNATKKDSSDTGNQFSGVACETTE